VSDPARVAPLSGSGERESPAILARNTGIENSGQLAVSNFQFTYHEILPESSRYLYRVSSAAFEEHLAFISSLTTAPRISFDDGHRSNYENALPILERFGVKATFFLLAGHVGGNKDYLSWGQAREMSAAGHRVASHGWSHRMLTQCSAAELDHELTDSKREIENRLGVEVDSISAPGGRWDKGVTYACTRAGYRHFFHSNPWTPPLRGTDLTVEGRLMITCQMGSPELQRQMRLSPAQRSLLRAKYAVKDGIRQIIGERLYHRIWCRLANWNPEDGMEVQVNGPEVGKAGLKRS
jgi:peptidoglycan/xylan/chitin deacetylase (PgdA/CDA1 family)